MVFKLNLNNDNGTIKSIEKNFTDKDIKTCNGHDLPEEDKAGEYLYIISFENMTLGQYYYKMSDKCTVPCSTGVSLKTVIE